uniref:Uncharacterized protein n=1 Tax=Siphoviridae sp. ctwHj1 TaxID=2825727 RepID=A0A8S5U630_9CAUD|nr:MAG TPA: hypothetical protein [Siphoviridae sp. ctwHj1]
MTRATTIPIKMLLIAGCLFTFVGSFSRDCVSKLALKATHGRPELVGCRGKHILAFIFDCIMNDGRINFCRYCKMIRQYFRIFCEELFQFMYD